MMAVDVQAKQSFSAGKPKRLFDGQYVFSTSGGVPNYDVLPDGLRFLMLKPVAGPPTASHINVVLNWLEELKRLVPTGK